MSDSASVLREAVADCVRRCPVTGRDGVGTGPARGGDLPRNDVCRSGTGAPLCGVTRVRERTRIALSRAARLVGDSSTHSLGRPAARSIVRGVRAGDTSLGEDEGGSAPNVPRDAWRRDCGLTGVCGTKSAAPEKMPGSCSGCARTFDSGLPGAAKDALGEASDEPASAVEAVLEFASGRR